jgi:hypothetical protein
MRRALTLLLFALSLPVFADVIVSTVTPTAGPIGGGTIVHIHGANLFATPPVECEPLDCLPFVMFGDRAGSVTFDSDGEMMVIAPAHEAGTVDLMVKVPLSPALVLKNAFTFQDPANDTVRVLLPIAAGTQGMFGTSWQTDVLAHNETTLPVDIAGTTIPPLATRRLTLSNNSTGMFLQIPRRAFESVTITTHVHDATHDADSLGVDIPSIPETQFRRAIVLTGVPNDPRYRVLLRVYGYPGDYPLIVRVRDDQTGELVQNGNHSGYDLVSSPELTYLQLPISSSAASPTLRVEVTGEFSTGPPIWGFITLTNNVTQSVTTITPNIGVASEAPWQPFLQPGHYAHAGNCMTVTSGENGTATVNTGCGVAHIAAPINVGTDGHFEAGGSYQAHGGPLEDARFTGLVSFGTVAFTIRTSTQTVGPLTFVYGSTEPCASACP